MPWGAAGRRRSSDVPARDSLLHNHPLLTSRFQNGVFCYLCPFPCYHHHAPPSSLFLQGSSLENLLDVDHRCGWGLCHTYQCFWILSHREVFAISPLTWTGTGEMCSWYQHCNSSPRVQPWANGASIMTMGFWVGLAHSRISCRESFMVNVPCLLHPLPGSDCKHQGEETPTCRQELHLSSSYSLSFIWVIPLKLRLKLSNISNDLSA